MKNFWIGIMIWYHYTTSSHLVPHTPKKIQISSKSIHNFCSNLRDKQTNKGKSFLPPIFISRGNNVKTTNIKVISKMVTTVDQLSLAIPPWEGLMSTSESWVTLCDALA